LIHLENLAAMSRYGRMRAKFRYQLHPKRFKNQPPRPPRLAEAVWINKPRTEKSEESELNFPETVSHFH
jgi:hypothetical protein